MWSTKCNESEEEHAYLWAIDEVMLSILWQCGSCLNGGGITATETNTRLKEHECLADTTRPQAGVSKLQPVYHWRHILLNPAGLHSWLVLDHYRSSDSADKNSLTYCTVPTQIDRHGRLLSSMLKWHWPCITLHSEGLVSQQQHCPTSCSC